MDYALFSSYSPYLSTLVLSHQMTGRKGRVVSDVEGDVQYESRAEADVPLDMLNIQEKVRFMNGEKVCVCIQLYTRYRKGRNI